MSDELYVAMVTTSLDDDEDLPEGPCVVLRGSIAAVKDAAKLFDQPVRIVAVPAPAVPDDVAQIVAELRQNAPIRGTWAVMEDAADLVEAQAAELAQARRTAEFWKANHLRGNAEIDRLTEILRTILSRAQGAKRMCEEGAPVSAFNLASGILGQIGSDVAALTHSTGD